MARGSCWTSCNSWWLRSNRHRTSFCWACTVNRDWTANAPFRVGRRCTWKSYKNFYSAPGICTSPHFPISKLRKHVAESWPNDASNCSYEIWPSFGRSRIQDEIDWNPIVSIWKRHWIRSQVISQHWVVRSGDAFKSQIRSVTNFIDDFFFHFRFVQTTEIAVKFDHTFDRRFIQPGTRCWWACFTIHYFIATFRSCRIRFGESTCGGRMVVRESYRLAGRSHVQ